jgi:hypothetical protein
MCHDLNSMFLVQVSARRDWVFVRLVTHQSFPWSDTPTLLYGHSPGRYSAPVSRILGRRLYGLLLIKYYDAIESIPYPIYESEIVVTSNRSRRKSEPFKARSSTNYARPRLTQVHSIYQLLKSIIMSRVPTTHWQSRAKRHIHIKACPSNR